MSPRQSPTFVTLVTSARNVSHDEYLMRRHPFVLQSRVYNYCRVPLVDWNSFVLSQALTNSWKSIVSSWIANETFLTFNEYFPVKVMTYLCIFFLPWISCQRRQRNLWIRRQPLNSKATRDKQRKATRCCVVTCALLATLDSHFRDYAMITQLLPSLNIHKSRFGRLSIARQK